MSTIKMSAYRWVPPFAQGLVRDLRVRWALEEAGMPYEECLLEFQRQAGRLSQLQPFGQVPTFEEDGWCSSNRAPSCCISQNDQRCSCRRILRHAPGDELDVRGAEQRRTVDHVPDPDRSEICRRRRSDSGARSRGRCSEGPLGSVAAWLGERDYLEDRFTAGDLLMVTVLRILRHTDMVTTMPALAAYRARCEARPRSKGARRPDGGFAENAALLRSA